MTRYLTPATNKLFQKGELKELSRLLDRLGIPYTKGHPLLSHQPCEISLKHHNLHFDSEGNFVKASTWEEGKRIAETQRRHQYILDYVEDGDSLIKSGFKEMGIDLIHSTVDEAFRNGRFEDVDKMLKITSIDDYTVSTVYSVVCATMPAHSKLKNRTDWVKAAVIVLKTRPEWKEEISCGRFKSDENKKDEEKWLDWALLR